MIAQKRKMNHGLQEGKSAAILWLAVIGTTSHLQAFSNYIFLLIHNNLNKKILRISNFSLIFFISVLHKNTIFISGSLIVLCGLTHELTASHMFVCVEKYLPFLLVPATKWGERRSHPTGMLLLFLRSKEEKDLIGFPQGQRDTAFMCACALMVYSSLLPVYSYFRVVCHPGKSDISCRPVSLLTFTSPLTKFGYNENVFCN